MKSKSGVACRDILNLDTAPKRGGWDGLAEALQLKIQRIRVLLNATRTSQNVMNQQDGDGVSIMAESDVSIAAMGEEPTVDEVMDWERWRDIKESLDGLPTMSRECIRRYVGFGCDQQDPVGIAEALRINRSTVWANIARAKEKLAVSLERYRGAA